MVLFLTKDNIDEYIRFVDAVVSAYVPDPNDNPELYKYVTTYQVHSHSKSCRKYKNKDCRYNFGRYFTIRTIVAVPLSKDLLRALIIDEISMVSNLQLLYIHLRLVEIFDCSDNIPFAGITVVACDDLLKLPPVQQRAFYAEYRDVWQNLLNLWKHFKIAKLVEVMRQKGDSQLIDLLNKVRIAY